MQPSHEQQKKSEKSDAAEARSGDQSPKKIDSTMHKVSSMDTFMKIELPWML
jgi:hypothetical protein